MASIHKDPRNKSPYFYCAFVSSDGKRAFKSTKQTDRKKAEVTCRAFEDAASEGRAGVLSEIQARKVLEEIYEKTGNGKIDFDTVASYLDGWLKSKAKNTSESTQRIYLGAITGFKKHLGNKAQLALRSLDKKHFTEFQDALMAEGKSNKTVNLTIGVLRTAMSMARREQKILSNPAEAVENLADKSAVRGRFDREQIAAILATADDEWRGAVLLGCHHALRLGDAANLSRANVDFQQKTIRFFPQKQKRKEDPKELVLPMHPDVEKCLLKLPVKGRNPRAPLFPSLHGREIKGWNGLSQAFIDLMEKAGIKREAVKEKVKGDGRNMFSLSFHSLRHTAISSQAECGIAKDTRKKLCGHGSDNVHARYTKESIESLRKEIEKVPSFLPEP